MGEGVADSLKPGEAIEFSVTLAADAKWDGTIPTFGDQIAAQLTRNPDNTHRWENSES